MPPTLARASLVALTAGLLACSSTPDRRDEPAPVADPAGDRHRAHRDRAEPAPRDPDAAASAVAVMSPTAGHGVTGAVTFTEVSGGVRVLGAFTGLTPGDHGFHVHERGDCSAPDGTSAGGHFAPMGHPHGLPDSAPRHAGDFGNLTADADGHAKLDRVFEGLALGGEHGVLGRGLIVHADPDDGGQPTGNAGARVACGVIGQATEAVANVEPTTGHTATGTVRFRSTADGTAVEVRLTGVPAGSHGFHVHEYGDCSAYDATSAGGHFNPENVEHGLPGAGDHHEDHDDLHRGDMGNITADADGAVHADLVFPHLDLTGPFSVLGRAVILHAERDDGGQPTGNAGGRIGCGRIVAAE